MTTVEMIFGPGAMEELASIRDPECDEINALLIEATLRAFQPKPRYDPLPAYYRKIEI